MFRPLLNLCTSKRVACSELAAKWLFGRKKAKTAMLINNGIDISIYKYDKDARNRIRNKYNIEKKGKVYEFGKYKKG